MSNENGNSACKNVGVGHLTDPAHEDHGQGYGYGHCDPEETPTPTPPPVDCTVYTHHPDCVTPPEVTAVPIPPTWLIPLVLAIGVVTIINRKHLK